MAGKKPANTSQRSRLGELLLTRRKIIGELEYFLRETGKHLECLRFRALPIFLTTIPTQMVEDKQMAFRIIANMQNAAHTLKIRRVGHHQIGHGISGEELLSQRPVSDCSKQLHHRLQGQTSVGEVLKSAPHIGPGIPAPHKRKSQSRFINRFVHLHKGDSTCIAFPAHRGPQKLK